MISLPGDEYPRWIIQETVAGRLFVVHTQNPRFFAELSDDVPAGKHIFPIGEEGNLVVLEWVDPAEFDSYELIASFLGALEEKG